MAASDIMDKMPKAKARPRPPSRRLLAFIWRRKIFLCVGALAATYLAERRMTLNQEYAMASLDRLMDGSAWTPYQFRALIPWVSGKLKAAGLFTDARRYFQNVEAIFLFATLVAFRQLIARFFSRELLVDLLSFTIFWVIPFDYVFAPHMTFFYPYDIPSVFFFTLGLLLLHQKNWKAYYPFFFIATFNREITCFLTLIYAISAYRRVPFKQIARHVCAQALIWGAVKFILWKQYGQNYGGGIYYNVMDGNLREWLWHPFLFSILGFVWIPVLLLRKQIADPFFQRAVLVFYPYMLAMLYVGRMDEIRIYGEMIPLMLLGAILILRETMRLEFGLKPESAGSAQATSSTSSPS